MSQAAVSPTAVLCTGCGRANLPGGVRCAYCGARLPQPLDFDMSLSGPAAAPSRPIGEATQQTKQTTKARGLVGLLAFLAVKAKFLLTLLKFGKILTTFSTMLVFIAGESLLFGWKLAAGFALCILVHEMGHVVVNWRYGIKQTAPMFIPFVGALIRVNRFPDNPIVEADCGAGGPVAGGLAAIVCLLIAKATGSPFWYILAYLGFFVNLFNLLPFPPLDGSHMAAAFSPGAWDAVLITLLLWAIKALNPMLWLILLVGFLFRLGRGKEGRYLLAAPKGRARVALLYVVLCLVLSAGANDTAPARGGLYGRANAHPQNASRSAAASHAQPVLASDPQENDTAQADSPPRHADSMTRPQQQVVVWVVRSLLVLAALIFWTITALLMRGVTQENSARPVWLAAVMILLLPALLVAGHYGPFPLRSLWLLLGAYFAASLAALIYAGYTAAHRTARPGRTLWTEVLTRCLGWAAGAALLVAYAYDDGLVAAGVALCALLFAAFHRWLPLALASNLYAQMRDRERAIALRQRALALRPDVDTQAKIVRSIARLNLQLERGGKALAALEARENLLASQIKFAVAAAPRAAIDWYFRATALGMLDRYDEATACIEQVLQAPPTDPLHNSRLYLARVGLMRLASRRGWPEEALAQCEACLQLITRARRPDEIAKIYTAKAHALTGLGRWEEARTECTRALAISRESDRLLEVALVRVQIALGLQDAAAAKREAELARRLSPDSLEVRYWHGRALLACNERGRGEAELRELAAAYPQEHWGRQADLAAGRAAAAMSPALALP